MPVIQAIMGSLSAGSGGPSVLPDPGGWYNSVSNSTNDLKFKIYSGYHNESINLSGLTLTVESYGPPNLDTYEGPRTWMFTGYMQIPTDGNYVFRCTADDGAYVWIGSYAYDGSYNIGNALINNGGLHSSNAVDSSLISMRANVWYPIRILFGNDSGGEFLSFQYTVNSASWATPTYAHNSATPEGFN